MTVWLSACVCDCVQGPPMMCTFFMSNMIHLHPTSTARAEELLQQHDGSLIFPPSSLARLQEIGPWEDSLFDVSALTTSLLFFSQISSC